MTLKELVEGLAARGIKKITLATTESVDVPGIQVTASNTEVHLVLKDPGGKVPASDSLNLKAMKQVYLRLLCNPESRWAQNMTGEAYACTCVRCLEVWLAVEAERDRRASPQQESAKALSLADIASVVEEMPVEPEVVEPTEVVDLGDN